MIPRTPRLFLAFSSLLLAAGGLIHARAFNRALAVIAGSSLPPFFANAFKVLWLMDSTVQLTLAAVFGLVAARPAAAEKRLVVLLAFIPAAVAGLLYTFLGSFFAAHMLLASAVAAFLAGLQFPGNELHSAADAGGSLTSTQARHDTKQRA